MKDTSLLKIWEDQLRKAGLQSEGEAITERTSAIDRY